MSPNTDTYSAALTSCDFSRTGRSAALPAIRLLGLGGARWSAQNRWLDLWFSTSTTDMHRSKTGIWVITAINARMAANNPLAEKNKKKLQGNAFDTAIVWHGCYVRRGTSFAAGDGRTGVCPLRNNQEITKT